MFRIDFVSTPFAGHLHPLIEVAAFLRDKQIADVRVISTESARKALAVSQLPFQRVLAGKDEIISNIANAPRQVGSNPVRLLGQLRDNLSMMDQLVQELRGLWLQSKPDLVIADFAVPVAGLLAKSLSIPWWTSLTSVSALETPDGVPTYLGGWRPMRGRAGRVRDFLGRKLVRSFKRSVHAIFRKRLRRLGISSVYRQDGFERIYSDEMILAWSPAEFEFPRRWPTQMKFLGPLVSGPEYPHIPPTFVEGKPHVLVSLGTHIRWAKERASDLIMELAIKMPDIEFHFTRGDLVKANLRHHNNYKEYSYFPYHRYMRRYAASINHVGTGVLFSSLSEGVPILAWPHDFDQFDHAARLEHFGLGMKIDLDVDRTVRDLRLLLTDTRLRQSVKQFQEKLRHYQPLQTLEALLYERCCRLD